MMKPITNITYSFKSRDEKIPERIDLIKRKYLDFIFPDLHDTMCTLKSKIDENDNSKLWDKAKRKVNPFELVNVIGTNILNNENIIKKPFNCNPLSRAFF